MTRSAVRTPAPTHITIVRVLASAQLVTAAIFSLIWSVETATAFRYNRAAERAGDPNPWAGLGEVIGLLLIVLSIASVLLIAIPLLQLRAGRPGPRIGLIVCEAVVALPFVCQFALFSHNGHRLGLLGLVLPIIDVLPLILIGLLCTAGARAWSDPPALAPYGYGYNDSYASA